MFVVSITYTSPGELVASHRPAHVEWLKAAFARGSLDLAGSKSTKDRGLLLTTHSDRESLEAELDQDPYRIHNVATHTITEFDATMTSRRWPRPDSVQ
ncbi:YciI family protein [Arthrobacter sp. 18067]|uniref:YciI family protein n=1 Tax=Arthrobacter sp. 18067 TaxID=2681413 RepID=UPI00135947F5|nr:YciI family protein [Arthrobacter sp. 18067]